MIVVFVLLVGNQGQMEIMSVKCVFGLISYM